MSQAAYSDLKAAWHLGDIADMRAGHQIVPRQVQLILSDLCNQDCHFCSYRMSNGLSSEQFPDEKGNRNPNRMIPKAKAKEILADCAAMGVGAIQFTGGGEPTVHPDHLELFAYAQELGMETGLVTNGVLLRKGWEAVLPKMAWIRVSIDASEAAEYARVRRVAPAMYERALGNLACISGETASQGTPTVLGAGYVITRENWGDLPLGVKRIKDAGAHYVRLSAMFSKDGDAYYEGIHDEIKAEIRAAKTLESDSFKVVDLFGDRISDLKQHAPDYDFCGYQQFNCYIGANLKVYRCCTTAYTAHGEVGDLSHQTFSGWFDSEAKRKAYADFNARSCNVCQFNNKNRTISYMVDPAPVHAQFV